MSVCLTATPVTRSRTPVATYGGDGGKDDGECEGASVDAKANVAGAAREHESANARGPGDGIGGPADPAELAVLVALALPKI